MASDTLSDVLRSVRLKGAVFYYVTGGDEWAAAAPPAAEIAAAVLPGAEHVMEYHVITKGSGWAAVAGEKPVRVETGDIVMFPHGDPHVLSSAPGLRPPADDGRGTEWMVATSRDPKPIPVHYQGIEMVTDVPADSDVATNVVLGSPGTELEFAL